MGAVVVVGAVAAVGCGGSGLSHEDFVRQANSICANAEAEFATLQKRFADASDDERRQLGRKLAEAGGNRIRELFSLSPRDDADRQLVAKLKAANDELQKLARTNDATTRDRAKELSDAIVTDFTKLGLTDCVGDS